MSGPPGKLDPFKPSQPAIPGVPEHPPEEKKRPEKKKDEPKDTAPVERPAWQSHKGMAGAGLSTVVLLAVVVLAWRATKPAALPAPVEIAPPPTAGSSASATPAVTVAPQLPDAPGPVVTVEEIAKPWTVAKFQFHRATGETVNGMVIRLPAAPGYWGLLSVAPYGRCQLELDTDLKDIREKYKYAAPHPMVVDPCTQAVYDPLALGSAAGVWVRGKVAAGPGIRPPLEVEIKVERGWVIASRSE
jgi:hypothetical protein